MRIVKLFVMLAVFAVMAVMPAGAWLGSAIAGPYGGYGPGYVDSISYTAGVGASASSDSFYNGVVSPFSDPFFGGGCGPFGFGGLIGGYAQNGFGGNMGAQNSAMGSYTRTTMFGLGVPNSLAFGIPVAGPSGLMYC